MKSFKKISIVSVFFACMILAACKEKLDLAPFNQIDSGTAFATADRCLLDMYGVYDAAQSGVYDPLNGAATAVRGYPFGAAALEQQDMRGEDMINVATFFATTYQATYNPTTPNNVNMWKELYALINKANISIDGFRSAATNGIINSGVSNQYEAECRFLRAMAHHELVIHFSKPYADGNGSAIGVPYRDFAIQSGSSVEQAKLVPRGTVAEDYAKMLTDLDYAESFLPAVQGPTTSASLPAGASTFRATKATAIALKMRIKLHQNNWAGVIAEGNKLIPAVITPLNFTSVTSLIGGWGLTPAVNGPFLDNASKESMFSIKNDPLDNPNTNASLARFYGQSTSSGGRGLCAISPISWNLPEWTCTDRRRTILYYNGTDNTGNTSKFTTKYIDVLNQSDWTPCIRWTEVLLTQAEAEARNNAAVSQRSIDLINTVRNRAIVDSVTNQYTLASFADKNALINAILKERRIEFLAEGKRWGDIHRLVLDPVFGTAGIPAKMVNGFNNIGSFVCSGAVPATGTPFIAYTDFRFLWPIPLQERNTNPIVTQNPGY